MKNKLILTIAFVACTFLGISASASNTISGKSETNFGAYTLTEGELKVVDNIVFRTWDLSYSDCVEKYTIYVTPAANDSKCFIVRNSKMEVKYGCSEGVFGASLLSGSEANMKKKELSKVLNMNALENQKLITSSPKTESEYLGLIACFLPLLY
jgi:hypothetical protein